MNRHWTRVIRLTASDALCEHHAPQAVETALLRDLRVLLELPGIRAEFRGKQPLLVGISGLFPPNSGNRLIDAVREHVRMREADGIVGVDGVRAAVADALHEELSCRNREIVAHVVSRHPPSAREIARRLEIASRGAVQAGVKAAFSADPPPRTHRMPLDLDQNLLAGVR